MGCTCGYSSSNSERASRLTSSGSFRRGTMKALARQHLWWPGLNSNIEEVVRKCDSCQQKTHEPTPELLHPWKYPERSWQRVHINFEGLIYGYT